MTRTFAALSLSLCLCACGDITPPSAGHLIGAVDFSQDPGLANVSPLDQTVRLMIGSSEIARGQTFTDVKLVSYLLPLGTGGAALNLSQSWRAPTYPGTCQAEAAAVSPADLKVAWGEVVMSGEGLGLAQDVHLQGVANGGKLSGIRYEPLYASLSGTVKQKVSCADLAGVTTTYVTDLSLRQGWNLVGTADAGAGQKRVTTAAWSPVLRMDVAAEGSAPQGSGTP